jgi:hypothetical protein
MIEFLVGMGDGMIYFLVGLSAGLIIAWVSQVLIGETK